MGGWFQCNKLLLAALALPRNRRHFFRGLYGDCFLRDEFLGGFLAFLLALLVALFFYPPLLPCPGGSLPPSPSPLQHLVDGDRPDAPGHQEEPPHHEDPGQGAGVEKRTVRRITGRSISAG